MPYAGPHSFSFAPPGYRKKERGERARGPLFNWRRWWSPFLAGCSYATCSWARPPIRQVPMCWLCSEAQVWALWKVLGVWHGAEAKVVSRIPTWLKGNSHDVLLPHRRRESRRHLGNCFLYSPHICPLHLPQICLEVTPSSSSLPFLLVAQGRQCWERKLGLHGCFTSGLEDN